MIVTSRLVLRPFVPSDLAAFLAYRREPDVARYQSWSPSFSDDEGRAFIEIVGDTPLGTAGAWVNLAMELSSTGEVVGDVGLCIDLARTTGKIGFTLAGAHQGRGYAREGVGAVCDYAMKSVRTLYGIADARNTASMKLLERLGFRRDGFHARQTLFKGELCDELLYRRDAGA